MLKDTQYHLQSVERVIRVLECFTMDEPQQRLTDISNQLEMSKAQVLRIVSTLEGAGFLVRDPQTKHYRLGLKMFHLGMIVRHHLNLRETVHPHLRRLVSETEETARLVVPDVDEPVCIDMVASPRPIRVHAQLGARMPWNAGSSAKVILAYLPEEKREEILSRGSFRKINENTITDPDLLREDIRLIQEQGYFVSRGDLTDGSRGVAAPLFDSDGVIAGAVSVTGPENRMRSKNLAHITDTVRQAAAEISRELGCQPYEVLTQHGDGYEHSLQGNE